MSLPGEVDAGEAVVLPLRRGGVAVGERAEKRVGEQAGYLDLRQSDGRRMSTSEHWDGLTRRAITRSHPHRGATS